MVAGDVVDKVDKFGFAYGTLPDHAGSGEERFLVEWDQDEGSVWYDIRVFSAGVDLRRTRFASRERLSSPRGEP